MPDEVCEMAYGTVNGVAALVPALNVEAGDTPDAYQAQRWLDQGAAVIDRVLSTSGYNVPVADTAALYTELTAINELYAAAMALRARGLDTVQGLTETRSDIWLREVRDELAALAAADLTALGVTQITITSVKRQRVRTVQLRRIDGYSNNVEGEWSTGVAVTD